MSVWKVTSNADTIEGRGGSITHGFFDDEQGAIEWVRDNASKGELAVQGSISPAERTYSRGSLRGYLGCNISEVQVRHYRSDEARREKVAALRAKAEELMLEADHIERLEQ